MMSTDPVARMELRSSSFALTLRSQDLLEVLCLGFQQVALVIKLNNNTKMWG